MYNPVFYVSLPSRSVKFHKIFLISDLYTVLLRSENPEWHVRKASQCGSKQQ